MKATHCWLATAGTALILSFSGAIAQADETACVGSLEAITVENLQVPEGGTCSLMGTRVSGNIKVESGAVLVASNVVVDGDIQAEDAVLVQVTGGSVIGGNIQVKQSRSAIVRDTQVGGDLQLEENTAALVSQNNVIGGNLQAFENSGPLRVFGNSIDGNLQCKENRPVPIGENNRVSGDKEDQCARF